MSSATQHAGGPAAAFTQRSIQADGVHLDYWEAGQGQPVVVLHGREVPAPSPLAKLLSAQFRVLAFVIPDLGQSAADEVPYSPHELGRALVRAAGMVGLERFALVSTGASVLLAIWQAVEASEQIDALILISPLSIFSEPRAPLSGSEYDPELLDRLTEIKAPTLLLLGTDDEVVPRETGRMYAERIPNCYYVLVYDAGHAIEAQRPDTLFATVRDFLERRETFVVNRASTVLNP